MVFEYCLLDEETDDFSCREGNTYTKKPSTWAMLHMTRLNTRKVIAYSFEQTEAGREKKPLVLVIYQENRHLNIKLTNDFQPGALREKKSKGSSEKFMQGSEIASESGDAVRMQTEAGSRLLRFHALTTMS